MSAIGIDFGNENCSVAVMGAGNRVETITNDHHSYITPSYVAFDKENGNRIFGEVAKNQMDKNIRNTLYGLKILLGRTGNEPLVKREIEFIHFNFKQDVFGYIVPEPIYLDDIHKFSMEEVTSMLLTKLKDITEDALNSKIKECVISVPSYFRNCERKALLYAAGISGLNASLLNESAAVALCYGYYQQDLPMPEEEPRNIIFVDCGHSCFQVFACAFNKGKLKMLACVSDPRLGGKEFNVLLTRYFCNDLETRYGNYPKRQTLAFVHFLAEIENLKKTMSDESLKFQVSVQSFMEDIQGYLEMTRKDMEDICSQLLDSMEETMKQCLDESKLKLNDIYAVETVGGGSNMPAIKRLIETLFGKSPSTNLNAYESVAKGCALQCAIQSGSMGVGLREFSISDVLNYTVRVGLVRNTRPTGASNGEEEDKKKLLLFNDSDQQYLPVLEIKTFPKNTAVPFSEIMESVLSDCNNLYVAACYEPTIPYYLNSYIATYGLPDTEPVKNVRPKVKMEIGVNIDGMITLSDLGVTEIEATMEENFSENTDFIDTKNEQKAEGDTASEISQQYCENGNGITQNQNANIKMPVKKRKASEMNNQDSEEPRQIHVQIQVARAVRCILGVVLRNMERKRAERESSSLAKPKSE